MDDSQKATEHGQLLDLVPRSEATHIAIGNGDWFDPDTWYNGEIPDQGAKVLIPKGVSVTYDGESDASLFTVRVDGELSFATDMDTKMLVDTLVVAPSGRLEIGTEDNPIQDDVNAEIVIANNGDIDINWDPSLLSRGVISHGQVEIHGAEKTSNLKVAETPMAGDTEIKLSDIPDNWQVGDTIVLTGTHKKGWFFNRATGQKEYAESEDEEVTITAINGDTITIDRPLAHDHDTPRDDLAAVVANTTRNITFRSEDGEASEVHHRGHVMFKHNQDVDVRYAAFDDLGRTDKSKPAFHLNTLDPDTIAADTNSQGRYSLHFHRTGTEDQDDPAIAMGNVVTGNPGWGFVHHSSHANFIDNVAFDVFGAAFVAEDGDETGIWWRNVAIKTEGVGYGHARTKSGEDVLRDDVGRTGEGFFFSGRMVEASENIAANTNHGFVWMTRTAASNPVAEHTDQPDAFYGSETARSNDQVPIQGFSDNEAFGTHVGLIVVKRQIQQNHDVRTVMDGFVNWETTEGVQLTYTSHYTLKNFDLIGTDSQELISIAGTGFEFGPQVFDLAINGLKVTNFHTGIDLEQRIKNGWTGDDIDHVLIDVDANGNDIDIEGYNKNWHSFLSSDDLVEGRLQFTMTGDTTISLNENLSFDGIKTDSIGSRDRQFASDNQDILFSKHILTILQADGYYETADGRNVMLLPDLVADRATGELLKFNHVITLDISDTRLQNLGVTSNGLIDLDSDAPDAQDDHVSVDNESSIIIDVLANDYDPDGDVLTIDGFTNPYKGDLAMRDDGKLVYTPFGDYEGTDTFDYWTADDNGQLTRATVTVDVFD
ncbi:G8 domain-containing protein, partial [Roseovarius sp. CAU 1744]|uniref:G8 domain-containing protein n=1 Tax=Roseovarius sp. CAU 1744 TaxID=3140368 RepID=UPI00325A7B72